MFRRFFFRKSIRKTRNEPASGEERKDAAPQLELLKLPDPSLNAPSPLTPAESSKSLWVDVGSTANNGDSKEPLLTIIEPDLPNERILDARLDTYAVLDLSKLCIKQIHDRGLQSLGLFRPHRVVEDVVDQYRLIRLFLSTLDKETTSEKTSAIDRDIFKSSLPPKQAFAEAIRVAGIHDVVQVLKWGLRHFFLDIFTTHDDDQKRQWLDSLPSDKAASINFTNLVLPYFSEPSQELLKLVLELIAGVATYAESSGMTSPHLCKLLGFWLLSQKRNIRTTSPAYTNFQDVYEDWKACSIGLQRIFVLYLQEEAHYKRLTIRLTEVLVARDALQVRFHAEDNAMHAVLRTSHNVKTALSKDQTETADNQTGSTKSFSDLLTIALCSGSDTVEGNLPAWKQLVDLSEAHQTDPLHSTLASIILTDEYTRLLEKYSPATDLSKSRKVSTDEDSLGRRRSLSVDSPVSPTMPSRANDLEVLHEHAASEPAIQPGRVSPYSSRTMQRSAVSATDLSQKADEQESKPWANFISEGFAPEKTVDSKTLQLDDPFEHVAGNVSDENGRSKLKRRRSTSSRPARNKQQIRLSLVQEYASLDKIKMQHKLAKIDALSIDSVFADVWLDAIADYRVRAHWPLFMVVQIKISSEPYIWLVIEEAATPKPIESLPASPASVKSRASTQDDRRKRDKLAFLSFTRRTSRRLSTIFVENGGNLPKVPTRQISNGTLKKQSQSAEAPPVPSIKVDGPLSLPAQASPTAAAPEKEIVVSAQSDQEENEDYNEKNMQPIPANHYLAGTQPDQEKQSVASTAVVQDEEIGTASSRKTESAAPTPTSNSIPPRSSSLRMIDQQSSTDVTVNTDQLQIEQPHTPSTQQDDSDQSFSISHDSRPASAFIAEAAPALVVDSVRSKSETIPARMDNAIASTDTEDDTPVISVAAPLLSVEEESVPTSADDKFDSIRSRSSFDTLRAQTPVARRDEMSDHFCPSPKSAIESDPLPVKVSSGLEETSATDTDVVKSLNTGEGQQQDELLADHQNPRLMGINVSKQAITPDEYHHQLSEAASGHMPTAVRSHRDSHLPAASPGDGFAPELHQASAYTEGPEADELSSATPPPINGVETSPVLPQVPIAEPKSSKSTTPTASEELNEAVEDPVTTQNRHSTSSRLSTATLSPEMIHRFDKAPTDVRPAFSSNSTGLPYETPSAELPNPISYPSHDKHSSPNTPTALVRDPLESLSQQSSLGLLASPDLDAESPTRSERSFETTNESAAGRSSFESTRTS